MYLMRLDDAYNKMTYLDVTREVGDGGVLTKKIVI